MRNIFTLMLLSLTLFTTKWAHSNIDQSRNPYGLPNCEDIPSGPCALLQGGQRTPVVKHVGSDRAQQQVQLKKQSRLVVQVDSGNFYARAEGRDLQVIALMTAFRKHESDGNYWARGKSGELGAYQFTPGCWNAMAPRCGVFVPLNRATPRQQDIVMYSQIKMWKDQGYTPKEIASMWNAGEGEPRAYTGVFHLNTKTHRAGTPARGWNRDGAYYDVARYCRNVVATYEKQKKKYVG